MTALPEAPNDVATRVPGTGTRLSTSESEQLERTARRLCSRSTRVDTPGWVDAARRTWGGVPDGLRHALASFRRDSGPDGATVIGGLPVDPSLLGPTPDSPDAVQRAVSVPAALLMLAAVGLGDPAAFRPEKSGALVQDVVPVRGRETFQGNAGSVLLQWHNENAFHPHRPDFVLLLCLRPDHDGVAGLRTAGARRVLPTLSTASRDALFRSEFVTEAPPSFDLGTEGTVRHPVFDGVAEDPDVRVDLAATTPASERAAAALHELGTRFEEVARTHVLGPGDLAIVDNRVAVHGRTEFTPRYDGKDRWLQRTFVLADLRRSRAWRPRDGHVLV